ncbi:MAG: flagellin [Lachnospiraceae bacterium]|nr:flagellin [Lachnospiraceae bacterium]
MVPAYAKGTKDISEGLEITSENNELAFDVDGTNYSITLAEGEYTCEELINEINDKLNGSGAPIVAKLDDNNLRLSYTSYGEHIIDNFSGSAKSDLFFQENSADGEKEVVHIQLSSRGGEENPDGSGKRIGQDGTVIDKFVLNTVSLGINSITISKPKYANKAIGRLAKANEMVSEIRSYYGAAQNRLESSIRGNDNTSENTQAAESRIRDVDMADEMVKNSKYSILQQASQAVLAQANSSAEGILTLLK